LHPALAALVFAAQAAAQDSVGARLQSIADSVLKARPRVPGLLVHVEVPKTGRKWSIASGWSDTATKTPLRANQPVRIASNTKTYTASAILRLVEKGTIALSDPIEKHLPAEFAALLKRGGYPTDRMTIELVLSHRSGLNEHPAVPSYVRAIKADPAHRWTRLEQVTWLVDSLKPIGAPGEKFSYSDTGFILLGAIIERYTGKSFGAGVRELVGLDRLGLKSTWMETLEPEPAGVAPRAHQYMTGDDTYLLDPSFDLYGGGGIAASVPDLAGFTTAVLTGKVFEKAATLDSMMVIRSTNLYDGYGFGLFRVNIGGRRGYGHSGFWGTISVHFPAEGVTIAVAETEQSQQGGILFGVLREALKAVAP
jgi:D-alanyl-D-alanine carboxypeptidase